MKSNPILIIEDRRLHRNGIVAMLRTPHGVRVVHTSLNEEESKLKIHRLKHNVFLLDIGAFGHPGPTVMRK